VQEGLELKPLVKEAITKEQLVDYATHAKDPNRIHLDEAFAKEAGFPTVIAHGMLSMAFLGEFLQVRFPEPRYKIKKFHTRFKKVTFPGDIISCQGVVVKQIEENLWQVSLKAVNQNQETTTDGEAHVWVETRHSL